MALLFMDSFDHYATTHLLTKWSSSNFSGGAITINASNGRHSSASLREVRGSQNTNSYVVKNVSASGATAILGMSIKVAAAPPFETQVCGIRLSGTTQIAIYLNPNMTLRVTRNIWSSYAALGTTTATLTAGSATYVELKVLLHPSAGTIDLRFNGTSVLSLTGQNTQAAGSATWNELQLGSTSMWIDAQNVTTDFDDLYLLDGTGSAPWNDFLGDVRADYCLVTGAGATTGWTPSAGSNWQNVDDATPNDDTDYNTATTVGLTDTFVVQDAPANSTIFGVQVNVCGKKADAGACSIAPVVRPSGTDQVGTNFNPGTSQGYGSQLHPTVPGTASTQWTEAGFNATEFGYKRTA